MILYLNPENESLLSLDILNQGRLSKQELDPQSSGISIKSEITDEFEAIWFNFLNTSDSNNKFNIQESNTSYTEGASFNVKITRYERSPHARQACINHYGLTCTICGFDFERFYGKAGKDFIHVNHLK